MDATKLLVKRLAATRQGYCFAIGGASHRSNLWSESV